jgi:hypothetical protein
MTREELIRDEDYTEQEAEKIILTNQLEKALERIEELEDAIKYILKLYDEQDIVYSFKNVEIIQKTLKAALTGENE